MTNDFGSSNPWFSGKRKSGDELTPPERKSRTTENDLMSTRRLVGAPDENEGRNRWFGVRQSYTNLPAHKLINDLQNGRYDPYASIDNVRTKSLDHMDQSQFEKQMPFTTPTMWAKRDDVTYTPPFVEDISDDWTVNSAAPSLLPISSGTTPATDQYALMPEVDPMEFVERYGSELPTETLDDMTSETQNTEFGCDDFSPVNENQNQTEGDNLYFLRNAANRLPAFKKPPRSLT